jgi:type II secretory pathway predicted ATPase ExeA
MDKAHNPYEPGAGRPPAALVGRDQILDEWCEVVLPRGENGRSVQSIALYGLRGVGKTVLLSRLAQEARNRDWVVAQIEAGIDKSFSASLSESLREPIFEISKSASTQKVLKAIKSALRFKTTYSPESNTWNFGIDMNESGDGGVGTGEIEADLTQLSRDIALAAQSNGVGLAILIDEAQDLDKKELVAICSTVHQISQEGLPCAFVLAGLPGLPGVLAEAKTYSERLFTYFQVDSLDAQAAADALSIPAAHEGVDWEPEAINFVVEQTGGYPYFLQQYGQESWNVATQATQISLLDAQIGGERANASLDQGFFRARWERATPLERKYMFAMAELNEKKLNDHEVSASLVAGRINKSVQAAGPIRSGLISKGIIYSSSRGFVSFTVPRMPEFILRQKID